LAYGLWVINWVHTKLQLGVILLPTLGAHLDLDVFGLNDQRLQLLQFIPETTTIALRDREFAG